MGLEIYEKSFDLFVSKTLKCYHAFSDIFVIISVILMSCEASHW